MNKFKAYAQAHEQRINYTIARFCRISTSFTNKFRMKENIHIKYYTLNIITYYAVQKYYLFLSYLIFLIIIIFSYYNRHVHMIIDVNTNF